MTGTLVGIANLALATVLVGCPDSPDGPSDHGPIAADISADLGDIIPSATDEQRATFERGRTVSQRRFDRSAGLGPAFNVTFCSSCHERPQPGGAAGLYRNFFLTGVLSPEGVFTPGRSAGEAGGVVRLYHYGEGETARPLVPEETNVIAQRNPIPFFGVGLLAELTDEEILKRADPDDRDGDGISGKPNYDRGFVGRFGRKSQTVSIEGFIRGPIFNHLGVTTDPLTEAQRAALPVDSSAGAGRGALIAGGDGHGGGTIGAARAAQAAAPDGPLVDDDGVADPEMGSDDLFDLVSFAMLLAAPRIEEPTAEGRRGRDLFDDAGCGDCHAPRLNGPRGPLPVYSDLLLHDMGEELADGLKQKEASGSEYRTQPLWGVSAVGPYLHDGRAGTLEQAILLHGGEGERSRDAFEAYDSVDRAAVIEFLMSLGGREQRSPGLIAPDAAVPEAGEYGGPVRGLPEALQQRFLLGRQLFDRDFSFADGAGGPRFNGDSCRACHFEPMIGGAGPRGVNVIRHGTVDGSGLFEPPSIGTILHRETSLLVGDANRADGAANVFEHRQTPHVFGAGLIDSIPSAAIVLHADPDDLDGDGISGRVSRMADGRVGRFGWKAQVPSLAEFTRDALGAEVGITLEARDGLTFGRVDDDDDVADPELGAGDEDLIVEFMRLLAPPPRQQPEDAAEAARGEELFGEVGCSGCHIPELPGASGVVPLYSDLLLHEILAADAQGIEDTSASMREFRTAPLWGISQTAPYLHSGEADTLDEAIRAHDGEATRVREGYEALDDTDRAALHAFLGTL